MDDNQEKSCLVIFVFVLLIIIYCVLAGLGVIPR